MAWVNYHSHTHYCDGTHPPEEYLRAALAQGVKVYGFSSHAPVPFYHSPWPMRPERAADYITEVNRLRAHYAHQIEVLLSMEIDFVPGKMGPADNLYSQLGFDYTLGSVHFVDAHANGNGWEIDGPLSEFKKGLTGIFDGDIKAAVRRYYALIREMVTSSRPDIVGHLDKIKMQNTRELFFDENESWYKNEVIKTLETIARAKCVMEVNTRGLYKKVADETYPSLWVLHQARELGIAVQINSDAHVPNEITGQFEKAASVVLEAGYTSCRIFTQGQWADVPLRADGLDIEP